VPDRPAPDSAEGRKPASYFGNPRADMVALLPRPLGRVLDVGCGAGATARAFRAAGATELVGIEVVAEEAERARAAYDRVVAGDALAAVRGGDAGSGFDTIACYDVLEHLADPLALVTALGGVAAPGARLHVSVPNARHLSLARDLYLRGTFGYTATGHRDSTHLRWFTRRDIEALVSAGGWTVRSATPALPGRSAAADRLTLGAAREFVAFQWRILAVR
jgi:SAM-dependent methyltransferase